MFVYVANTPPYPKVGRRGVKPQPDPFSRKRQFSNFSKVTTKALFYVVSSLRCRIVCYCFVTLSVSLHRKSIVSQKKKRLFIASLKVCIYRRNKTAFLLAFLLNGS